MECKESKLVKLNLSEVPVEKSLIIRPVFLKVVIF